ncbi:MAG: hypothetical protein L6Q83_05895 [Gammaproteobacteria bacterium]|nr:hypothetical protein [Gammaproteobacteria bacterium]
MSNPVLSMTDVDRLGQALLALTRELWVLRDRQRILEAALVEAGALLPNVIDAWQPDAALQQILSAERGQLIDAVLDALADPAGGSAARRP